MSSSGSTIITNTSVVDVGVVVCSYSSTRLADDSQIISWDPFSAIPLLLLLIIMVVFKRLYLKAAPQWGAADAEIKVPSGENTELKRSPFQAWSRSVYSHTCYAYCQAFFLSCLFLHFRSIRLHFFQNLSRFFPVLAVTNTWFLCRPTE